MSQDDVVLLSVRQDSGCGYWAADVLFRDNHYAMRFQYDKEGDTVCEVTRSGFATTIEGWEISETVKRVCQGEVVTLPRAIHPGERGPRLPSVRDRVWGLSSGPVDVFLASIERVGGSRFVAHLLVNGCRAQYEVKLRPGPVFEVLHEPEEPGVQSYVFDLQGLLLRAHAGENLALPVKLQARWPTPEAPAAQRPDES